MCRAIQQQGLLANNRQETITVGGAVTVQVFKSLSGSRFSVAINSRTGSAMVPVKGTGSWLLLKEGREENL